MYIHRPFHDISCERNRARRHVNLGMTRNCLTNLSTSESESGYVILKRVFFLLPPNRGTNTSITSTLLELSFSKKIFLDVEKRKKKNGLCELNVFQHLCQTVIAKWWVNHSLWIVSVFCSGLLLYRSWNSLNFIDLVIAIVLCSFQMWMLL